MVKVKFKDCCDKVRGNDENPFFRLDAKGKALFCGVTYPTENSRSDIACKKALEIGADSFIRRPSLCDEAMDTISTFINEGIYIFQEADKRFLCSTAILYVFRGRARWVVSGNAGICHFRNGKLINRTEGSSIPLFGERVRWNADTEPEFDVSEGENAFLLYSAGADIDFKEKLSEIGQRGVIDDPAGAIVSDFGSKSCSAAAFVLPNKRIWI